MSESPTAQITFRFTPRTMMALEKSSLTPNEFLNRAIQKLTLEIEANQARKSNAAHG